MAAGSTTRSVALRVDVVHAEVGDIPLSTRQSSTIFPRTDTAMSHEKAPQLTDLQQALNLVSKLEKQAQRIDDPELKRILLISGCDIIDRVLEQQHARIAA